MKLSISTSSLHKRENLAMQLHDFKANLCKTLNSNYLQQFNKQDQKVAKQHFKRNKKKKGVTFSKPCMPVKVNKNASYTCQKPIILHRNVTKPVESDSSHESDLDLANHEIYSDFFDNAVESSHTCNTTHLSDESIDSGANDSLNSKKSNKIKNDVTLNHSSSLSSKSSTNTFTTIGTQSDSGLSSLNSSQLFFAEIREYLIRDLTENGKSKCSRLPSDSSGGITSSTLLSFASKISNPLKWEDFLCLEGFKLCVYFRR